MTSSSIPLPAIGSFESYTQYIRSIDILSASDEHALAIRSCSGDIEAAQKLVIHNLRFVLYIVDKYTHYGICSSDLMQSGTVGLMKAIKKFDPMAGIRLVTYAVHHIKAEIHAYIISNWHAVKIATTRAQRKLFFNLRSMCKNGLSQLTHDETVYIANELNVDIADVRTMAVRLNNPQSSMDTERETGDGETYTLHDTLTGDTLSPEDEIIAQEAESERLRVLAAVNKLAERDRNIITRRFLVEAPETLSEIATTYGISIERVRQIESAALKKLRGVIHA